MNRPEMSDSVRLALAAEVFDQVFEACESFRENNIGADLAYLMGAIVDPAAKESYVDWSSELAEQPALIEVLRTKFLPHHHVWQFIRQ